MKNLEFNQMETVNGGLSGRNCLLMGAGIAILGLASGIGGAIGGVLGAGAIGGFFTAATSDCF